MLCLENNFQKTVGDARLRVGFVRVYVYILIMILIGYRKIKGNKTIGTVDDDETGGTANPNLLSPTL